MMKNRLNNEYERLLEYLISQDQLKNKAPVKEKKLKKVENVEISNTKKLIEDSKIYGYIPGKTVEHPPPKKSKGFNVSKFESIMRAKLVEEYKKIQSYERPYVSVSELYSCIRQVYYNRLKYPVDAKRLYTFAYLYLIQRVGNVIHDVIQELYNFSEVEKTIVSERFHVKGRVDGIRDRFLFEIKSIDFEKFKNQYIREHYLQAVVYAYILNKEYNYSIDTITIIYVIRNLKRIVPFDLPVDDKLAESLLSKAPILKSSIDNLQVPDPIGATQESCRYCVYIDQCKEDKIVKVSQPFMKKKKKVKEVEIEQKGDDKKSAFLL
jgi:hypothetical protein